MGDVNPREFVRTPLKPREIALAITRGNSYDLQMYCDPADPLNGFHDGIPVFYDYLKMVGAAIGFKMMRGEIFKYQLTALK